MYMGEPGIGEQKLRWKLSGAKASNPGISADLAYLTGEIFEHHDTPCSEVREDLFQVRSYNSIHGYSQTTFWLPM